MNKQETTTYKQKLSRILALTGWSRDYLADLLMISNRTFRLWLKSRPIKKPEVLPVIDELYAKIVLPYQSAIDCAAATAERKILQSRLSSLPTSCPTNK